MNPAPLLHEDTRTSDNLPISCATCQALCCRLEVLLMGDDDVPGRFTAEDAWGGEIMRQLDDGWCAALDRATMLCTIYERRPGICRDYEMDGNDCREETLAFRRTRAERQHQVVIHR